MKFAGQVVDASGLHADTDKIKALIEMCQPNNKSEIRCFLGMINQLGKFVEISQKEPSNYVLY